MTLLFTTTELLISVHQYRSVLSTFQLRVAQSGTEYITLLTCAMDEIMYYSAFGTLSDFYH
jgi:hypothetical protein